jgi:glutamate carboxypeptidase
MAQTNYRLLDYLHHRQSAMTELLETLVRAESPSAIPAAQQPVLTLLQDALETRGYRVRRFPGRQTGGHLVAVPSRRDRPPISPGQRSPLQLLLGHCDTVWPLGTLDTMPLVVKQGKLYGPGTYDMKAGLVLTLFALEALQTLEMDPIVPPVWLVNSDEEIGSEESTPHIERLAKRANRVFVMEPSLGPAGRLKTQRRGVGQFTVRVLGRAAHAGLEPEKGASAILELSFVIQQLFALNDPQRGISVNVGTIDGGIGSNVIAPESTAVVDVRVLHKEDAPRIEAAILNLQPTTPNTQLLIEGGIGRLPMEKTPGNRQLWHRAQQAAVDLGIAIDEGTAGGSSDGNTTSLFAPTLDGLGAVGENAHAVGECVYLDQLVERSALLARLLIDPPLQGVDVAEK